MELVQGVIEAISAKELAQEDQWGNTHRLSIKIGEDWIGLGTGKRPDINIKEGAGWYKLKQGDEIALVVDQNGQYLNGQKKTLKLLKKGNGLTTQSSSGSQRTPQSGSSRTTQNNSGGGVDWAAKDAGAAASASIDKALRYIALRNGEVKADYDTVLSIARDMQRMVKTLASEIQHGTATSEVKEEAKTTPPAKATNGLAKKPTAKKQVEPDEEDFADDEIPF